MTIQSFIVTSSINFMIITSISNPEVKQSNMDKNFRLTKHRITQNLKNWIRSWMKIMSAQGTTLIFKMNWHLIIVFWTIKTLLSVKKKQRFKNIYDYEDPTAHEKHFLLNFINSWNLCFFFFESYFLIFIKSSSCISDMNMFLKCE